MCILVFLYIFALVGLSGVVVFSTLILSSSDTRPLSDKIKVENQGLETKQTQPVIQPICIYPHILHALFLQNQKLSLWINQKLKENRSKQRNKQINKGVKVKHTRHGNTPWSSPQADRNEGTNNPAHKPHQPHPHPPTPPPPAQPLLPTISCIPQLNTLLVPLCLSFYTFSARVRQYSPFSPLRKFIAV